MGFGPRVISAAGLCVGVAFAADAAASAFGHPISAGLSDLWQMNWSCHGWPALVEWRNSTIAHWGRPPLPVPGCPHLRNAVVEAVNMRAAACLGVGALPLGGFVAQMLRTKAIGPGRTLPQVRPRPGQVVIEFGRATDIIPKRGEIVRAIQAGQSVRFTRAELCLHLIAFGGTGSGKTGSWFVPILRQFIEQWCGALVSNSKGNFDRVVVALAEAAGREDDVRVIGYGDDAENVNLFSTVPPNMIATYTSPLLRMTDKSEKSGLWNAIASQLAETVGTILWYYRKYTGIDHYSYPGIQRFLFRPGFGEALVDGEGNRLIADASIWEQMLELIQSLETRLSSMPPGHKTWSELKEDIVEIKAALHKYGEHRAREAARRSDILFTLSQLLDPLTSTMVAKAFFNTDLPKDAVPCDMSHTYSEGTIFVVDAPEDIIGEPASRVVTALTKKLFFNAAGRRRYYGSKVDQDKLVGCFFDECQDVISEGDQTTIAKLRDTGVCCVWATQTVVALDDKIGERLRKAVLGNMRQKFLLRGEDADTNESVLKLVGDLELEKESTSTTTQPGKWGKSKQQTKATERRRAVTADVIFNLTGDQVYYSGTIGRDAAVGVLTTRFEDPLA